MSEPIPQEQALNMYLAMLAGGEPDGGLLELREKPKGGTIRRVGFFDAADRPKIMAAVARASKTGDIYVGLAPRVRAAPGQPQGGGVEAIARCWVLWVDCDSPQAADRLAGFLPRPAMVIESGRGLHAYWPLREPLTPTHAKRANRRLAHALLADMNATDGARIMRPPATLNWKTDPPRPVFASTLETVAYTAADVVGELPDPPTGPERLPASGQPIGTGNAALAGVAAVIRSAQPGNRNHVLNWAAFRMGPRIATGELTEQEVRTELHAAAAAAGLADDEIDVTLRSGLRAGVAA